MLIKRLILAVISLVFGFAVTYATITAVGTNLEEYGGMYTFFTALALACALGIWLDKLMGTEILPK
jgi:hypothetical protein